MTVRRDAQTGEKSAKGGTPFALGITVANTIEVIGLERMR